MAKQVKQHPLTGFPIDFLWGAATSAFQVEGNNIHADFWDWEQTNLPNEQRSGQAIDHYHHFSEDFALAKKYQQNAHRLSLEWSRIEPAEGVFDLLEIDHYRQVLQELKKQNLVVFLTLHHFTNPEWFTKMGGWKSAKATWFFNRFVQKVVPEFAPWVDYWITINEPGVLLYHLYINSRWPGSEKSWFNYLKTFYHLVWAHRQAYHFIQQRVPQARVGVVHNITCYSVTHPQNPLENLVKWWKSLTETHLFYLLSYKTHDFLGVNYYFHNYINLGQEKPERHNLTRSNQSQLGWEIYPQGLYRVLKSLKRYHLPIFITENGLATNDETQRTKFLTDHLAAVLHALREQIVVKGYFYWSLLDNFEWTDGWQANFGLIGVNRKTMHRLPKKTITVYAEIIRANLSSISKKKS
ncbi:family 1 glycosylhydrolase [Patescibacteria group bacterium]|nr:family 1 glycosylhydrolase [Patescibacteria group bacterium]MCL5409420.1 family 1 glycosylhydrolase [Patescibacteria group bacterium]